MQYAFHIEAASKSEAMQKACRAIREHPETMVASIEQPDAPKGSPGLLKRLVTGR